MTRPLVLVLAAGIAAGLHAADVGLGSHATAAQYSARCPPLRDSGEDDHLQRNCHHLALAPAEKEGRELATTEN